MKIILFSLLGLFLIGMVSYSYAQWTNVDKVEYDFELPQVLLQLEVRDPNGGLVSYLEDEQIIGISPMELNRFLDNQNQTRKEFFVKDGTKYESHQWEIRGDKFNVKSAFSSTRLLDIYENELVTLIVMRHDSYQTEPGDSSRVFWTIIRPVS